jgi:hypothetical protein
MLNMSNTSTQRQLLETIYFVILTNIQYLLGQTI